MNKKKLFLLLGLSLHSIICFARFPAATHRPDFKTSFGICNSQKVQPFQSSHRLTTKMQHYINTTNENTGFMRNRRNIYSGLWAFASLNYLYADLAGLMDANMLQQYMTGNVSGTRITPGFLTIAAGFMQIPLSNVFLPQVIKNDRALRWVQLSSGALMTLVQAGTLFVGKPTPYYLLFSAIEIAATTFITVDAIRWKPQKPLPQQF
jgi:hypothetical protein